jgi:short subunit dehydrogenase-like uncharacterized protein
LAAGRDRARIEALAQKFGPQVEGALAALDDTAGLQRLVARASVVLNCAGPFATCGATR